MPKENYRRIIKGYQPREPATLFEKLFYIFWSVMCAFKVVLIRIYLRAAKENSKAKYKE